jgi:diadenosine tetraphosphatase ApaH/serine/threonine PP2A family protein phosphatase
VRAIVSDIHSNLAALEAVLEDIRGHDVSEIYCLGDVIGYGPDPGECLDRAREFDLTLLGNHEQALLVEEEQERFNSYARGAITWTRQELSLVGEDREVNAPRWDFVGNLPKRHEEDGLLFVHASPRKPVTEYLRPNRMARPATRRDVFDRVDHLCFVGHTHVPGIFCEDGSFLEPEQIEYRHVFGDEKAIVNVGSVGQPRDRDPRASYALYDDGELEFRRVSYPIEETMEKIQKTAGLDPFLAQRLASGQ